MSLANYSFSQTPPNPPQLPLGYHPSNPQKPIGYMIDLSSKAVDKVRQPSLLMSPADINSMQTTAIDIGISNRTSAKKIGSKEVIGITEAKNGYTKKKRNSRNSSTHRFSMTLNNVQFAKLQGGKVDLKHSGKELPGPGVYDPSDALSKDRIRSALITKGPERFHQLPRQDSPGPGNYYRDEYFARNASPISLKGKAKEVQSQMLPGPGAYDPTLKAVKDALRSVNISSSLKPKDFKLKNNEIPGPGAYEIGMQNEPKITLKGKIPTKTPNDNPGPGSYQLPLSVSPTVKIVIGQPRFKDSPPSDSTGPGMYEMKHKSIGTDGPKFSLGGKTYQKRSDESPGPGQYDGNITPARSKSPSFRMRGRDYYQGELKEIASKPGPGSYQPVPQFGTHAPKISMHGKPASKQVKDSSRVGPGQYEAKLDLIKSRILTPILSSSQRGIELKRADSPGPGAYEQNSQIGKNAPQFTLKPRIERNERSMSPGPGQYDPKRDYVKDTVKTFKISGTPSAIDNMRRISQLQSALMPGPGAYDQQTTIGRNSPMISIKGKSSYTIINDVPGPGEYDPLKSLQALRDKSKGAKISGSTKSTIITSQQQLPGPGAYDPTLQKTSFSFSLLGKIEIQKKEDTPGPGVYDIPTPSQVRFKNPSFDFSKSPERDRVIKASIDLGPGAYNQINDQVLISGRSQIVYSFGKPSLRESASLSATPGPGAYDLPKTFGIHKKEGDPVRLRSRGGETRVVYK